jgi:broad specificity phosphatase PhoE
MSQSREVYLIRHGQTDWNVQKRWQGTMDTPLNEEGQRQALLLGEYMRQHHHVDALYSSDLSRAWDTAVTIAEIVGVKAVPDVRLRETNVGIFQGYTGDELQKLHPHELLAFRSGQRDFVIPKGESLEQVEARALEAFHDIMGRVQGNIALVSHGGWISQLLRGIFGDIEQRRIHISNTSITTLVEAGSGWRLDSVSVTPHLDTTLYPQTNQINTEPKEAL